MSRVFWTDDELHRLAVAAGRIRAHAPTTGWLQLINDAQSEALFPAERRRNITALTNVKTHSSTSFKELVLAEQRKFEEQHPFAPEKALSVPGLGQEKCETSVPVTSDLSALLTQVLTSLKKELRDTIHDAVLQALVDMNELEPGSLGQVTKTPETAQAEPPPRVTVTPPLKVPASPVKVLVVGLPGRQQEYARRGLSGYKNVELSFLKDEMLDVCVARSRKSDVTYLMRQFVPSDWPAEFFRSGTKNEVVEVCGSVSVLVSNVLTHLKKLEHR